MTGPHALRVLSLALAALLAGAGCAGDRGPSTFLHTRADYEAFRARTEGLLEPNYLPFMADRIVVESRPRRFWRQVRAALRLEPPDADEWLVFCRWPDSKLPLAVFVDPPDISPALFEAQAPGAAREPGDYVAAVERALRVWELGLEGLVTFEKAPKRSAADIVLQLRASEPPGDDPFIQVLGTTPLGGACRYRGGEPRSGRVDVDFRVETLDIYVADQHGLLLADQVERIALHEIGHALGMRTHSPIPADLMYRVVRDRLPRGELGTEDVNSFVSFYRLPNGTVYRRVAADEPEADAPVRTGPPTGLPRLALAPHVDARLGFEIQLPDDWTRLETTHGVVAVDGVTWDYEVSFQLNVRDYPTIRAYLERYGAWHIGRGEMIDSGPIQVGPYPGVRFLIEIEGGRVEEVTLLEPGDGRIAIAIWDSPIADHEAWQPWFRATLGSLELRSPRVPASDREYAPDSAGP